MSIEFFQKTLKFSINPHSAIDITQHIKSISEIKNIKIGFIHLQLLHTSASIILNENYDHDVKLDMCDFMKKLVPFSKNFRHSDEGPDDMPAHIKSALLGTTLIISITNGKLNLGTWQGIWLLEFRDFLKERKISVTIQGKI